jgi:D-3-phosphoglycerate dehydrogenase
MVQRDVQSLAVRSAPATIVIAEPLSTIGVELLERSGVMVILALGRSRAELFDLLRTADGLVVRSETLVDAALLRACGRLRVVARAGVGINTIDVDAATAAGVLVLNTPGGNAEATAEHTMGLIIAVLRRYADAMATVRSGRWTRGDLTGNGLGGKTLGVVGLGRVGRDVAKRASGFGMRLVACDPYVTRSSAAALGVDLVPFDELMRCCDVLTLHAPLTSETYHLVDDRALALLRPGSFVVNCARGAIIDEQALLRALNTGVVAAAALDVLATEPPSPAALRGALVTHPRVVITPHIGGSTHEALAKIATRLALDLLAVLRGELPANAVNPQAFAPSSHPSTSR